MRLFKRKKHNDHVCTDGMTFTEWLDKQPDYGIIDPPMEPELAIKFLFDYLELSPIPIPENSLQCNTNTVYQILYRYSSEFRQEIKEYKKRN